MEIAMVGIGFIAGVLGGMLGVGAGWLMIPAMVLLLGIEQQTAQGVSLCVIVFLALSGAITHWRQGTIQTSLVLSLIPGAVIFALLGAWAVGLVPDPLLTRVFGGVLLLIGAEMLLGLSDRLTQRKDVGTN